ncbi:MAG TPA: AAA domain-containing protein [Mycobacteriales bacterium]|nr:AAA domain-containing protein [Mycobacteriales bacterium]
MDDAVDRAARVYKFLLERQKRRTSSVTDLRGYPRVLWLGTLPNHPGLVNAAHDRQADSWLVINRVENPPHPEPPADLAPWLDAASLDDWESGPPLLLHDEDTPTPAEVHQRYAGWCARWQAWADDRRAGVAVTAAYRDLYAIYQESQALTEQYELVLCVGYLTGDSGRQHIRRHLVTTAASVGLDTRTGQLRVGAAAESTGLMLEEEMLDGADALGGAGRDVRDLLAAAGDDPFGPDVHAALHGWALAHGPSTGYSDQVEPHQDRDRRLQVSHAPALILRERTRRAYVDAFATLEQAVRDQRHVPEALRDLIDPRTDSPERGSPGSSTPGGDEVYFPAPSNEEQRRIVARLRRDRVVVVQGPPGTGKTHTIGNLITDLLAHGNRVLVTSHTVRALEELRDKLPEQIQDLCVSMAGDSGRGQRGLEQSVQTLLDRLDGQDENRADRERARLEGELAAARTARARAARRLREAREGESYVYPPTYGDYQGTAAAIAERLRAEQGELGWLGPVPKKDSPLTAEEALRFLWLCRGATAEVRQRAGEVPAADRLVPADRFAELAERHAAQEERVTDERQVRESAQYQWLAALDVAQRSGVDPALTRVETLLPRIAGLGDRFDAAVAGAWSGRYRPFRDQGERTAAWLNYVQACLAQVGAHQITGLSGVDIDAAFHQVSDLRERVASGRKLAGPLGGRSRQVKDARSLLDRVRVDTARLDRRPDLVEVLWLALCAEVELGRAERELGLDPTGSTTARIGRLADERETVGLVVEFGDALAELHRVAPANFLWTAQTITMGRAASHALALDDLRAQVAATVEPARGTLRAALAKPGVPAAVSAALRALDGWDADAYADACQELDSVRQANVLLGELAAARDVVADTHPDLAGRIAAEPDDPAWPDRLARITDAWNWSVWDAEIRDLADPAAERRLSTEVEQADRVERDALCALAANLAWDSCLSRVKPADRLHLNGYVKSIKRIGGGRGKYVNRYRAEARNHLNQCQHAVPAWIMPLYRVADSIPMDTPNRFDVAIIDEASQSGPEALLLLWLARRIVVVGDDQQVSPEEVGQDRGDVQRLIDTHIPDVPAGSLFQVGSSFFDLATASGSVIKLLEHFRCMPEIIAFSNRECYGGALRPLRQYGRDRLDPLRHSHVVDAVVTGQQGRITNVAEADALVEQIASCCADPAYAGRSMGVITLQGNAQQRLIQDRLMLRLPVSEIQRRGLRVGNAESFQGAERDVIFLSMVAAVDGDNGTRRVVAQTRDDARRRFNVAASRARDQVWLFHSVQLGDLSGEDLRYRYLEFVSTPPSEQDEIELAGVTRDVRVAPFDSLFEQRVYLDLRARGFRVRPQYPALGYYIDLVVEGGTSRLAVECDGDAFHGPDRADYDGARERDLRRVGWEVWRLRASTYARDPAGSLEPLWRLLQERGITPPGRAGAPPAADPPAAEDGPRSRPTDPVRPAPAARPVPIPNPARTVAVGARPRVASTAARPASAPHPAAHRNGVNGTAHRAVPPGSGTFGGRPLPARAHDRLQRERELLRGRMAEQPPLAAVDRAAARAQQHDHDELQRRLAARLAELDRLLDQAVVTERGGPFERAFPGCVMVVRDGGTSECYTVTIAEAADTAVDYEAVKPDSAMGVALAGAVAGRSVTFQTPSGPRTVDVVEIGDGPD